MNVTDTNPSSPIIKISHAKTVKPVTAAGPAKAKTRKPKVAAEPVETPPTAPPAARSETKRSILIGLLRQPEGATVPQLSERLGWLPHTVRAALTGLRKAGLGVERSAGEAGASVYRLKVDA